MKNIFFLILTLLFTVNSFSQFFLNNNNELKAGISKYNGYFNYYYDDNSDKIFLEIENLDEEFLYVRSLSEGIGSNDIGLDRGQLGGRSSGLF